MAGMQAFDFIIERMDETNVSQKDMELKNHDKESREVNEETTNEKVSEEVSELIKRSRNLRTRIKKRSYKKWRTEFLKKRAQEAKRRVKKPVRVVRVRRNQDVKLC